MYIGADVERMGSGCYPNVDDTEDLIMDLSKAGTGSWINRKSEGFTIVIYPPIIRKKKLTFFQN